MPEANLHFPKADVADYVASWNRARCAVTQGGQGEIKHWAFNDTVKREGQYADAPPTPAEYRALSTRVVDLHPVTLAQNARTSGGGSITLVPQRAITVGPLQTWQAEKVSMRRGERAQRRQSLLVPSRGRVGGDGRRVGDLHGGGHRRHRVRRAGAPRSRRGGRNAVGLFPHGIIALPWSTHCGSRCFGCGRGRPPNGRSSSR
jgi:hypothetical protein